MSAKVLLLNGDYQPHDTISWKKAIRLILAGKAEAFGNEYYEIRGLSGISLVPKILRLFKIVKQLFRTGVRFTKRNIFLRDDFTCVYCGSKPSKLTLDHVVPTSRGGRNTFENVVTSCQSCNHNKGDKTLTECKMYFKNKSFKPYQPTIGEFIRMKLESAGVYQTLQDAMATN